MKRLARLFYHLSVPSSYTPEDEEDQCRQRLISTVMFLLMLMSVPIVISVIPTPRKKYLILGIHRRAGSSAE